MNSKPRFLGNGQIFWRNRRYVLDHIVKDATKRRINGRVVEDNIVYLIKTYMAGSDIPCTFAAKRVVTYKMPEELASKYDIKESFYNIIWIDFMDFIEIDR